MMADESSRELIQALMAEVVQGAHACGHEIATSYAGQIIAGDPSHGDLCHPALFTRYRKRWPEPEHRRPPDAPDDCAGLYRFRFVMRCAVIGDLLRRRV